MEIGDFYGDISISPYFSQLSLPLWNFGILGDWARENQQKKFHDKAQYVSFQNIYTFAMLEHQLFSL